LPEVTIIVEYETRDGREAEFTALIRDHAGWTLHEEPGCLRFEVLKPVEPDGTPIPNRLMISELYADEAALAAHK
jgi:quinol monooxygenase YgiN